VATAVRVGVQLPEVERRVGWAEYLAMARAAEEVGLDSIWTGDHLLYRGDGRPERGPWDAWALLAALAAVTTRVRLGPLVACTAFHPPGVLARMAATVDEVSGGRFVLGIGAGWNEAEFRAFGLSFDSRASRFEEAFAIVRRLLDGERVTFAGRFFELEDAVLLPRPTRRPPLMIGSTGQRVLATALPHVDAWNTWYDLYGNTPDGLRRELAKVDDACERVGRDPAEVARSACVLVVFDRDAGERPLAPGVEPLEADGGRIADGIGALSEAGADEIIVVASPITEASVRTLGESVAAVRA
jgi:probable F420-dependent oxidoreductase